MTAMELLILCTAMLTRRLASTSSLTFHTIVGNQIIHVGRHSKPTYSSVG